MQVLQRQTNASYRSVCESVKRVQQDFERQRKMMEEPRSISPFREPAIQGEKAIMIVRALDRKCMRPRILRRHIKPRTLETYFGTAPELFLFYDP